MSWDLWDDDEPPCIECGGWHRMERCHACGGIVCATCFCEADDDDDRDDFADDAYRPEPPVTPTRPEEGAER